EPVARAPGWYCKIPVNRDAGRSANLALRPASRLFGTAPGVSGPLEDQLDPGVGRVQPEDVVAAREARRRPVRPGAAAEGGVGRDQGRVEAAVEDVAGPRHAVPQQERVADRDA